MPHVEMLKRRFIGAMQRVCGSGQICGSVCGKFRRAARKNLCRLPMQWTTHSSHSRRQRREVVRLKCGASSVCRSATFFASAAWFFPKGSLICWMPTRNWRPSFVPAVGLLFVGDGVEQPELEARARAIHPGTVRFAGFAHREQLAVYYALAEALVFPTHTDPWGLVVNEAMACGIPIVATDAGGCVVDLVQDGWNGYVVPKSAPGKLAEALAKVAGSPELNTDDGSAQRTTHRTEFPSGLRRRVCGRHGFGRD